MRFGAGRAGARHRGAGRMLCRGRVTWESPCAGEEPAMCCLNIDQHRAARGRCPGKRLSPASPFSLLVFSLWGSRDLQDWRWGGQEKAGDQTVLLDGYCQKARFLGLHVFGGRLLLRGSRWVHQRLPGPAPCIVFPHAGVNASGATITGGCVTADSLRLIAASANENV